MRAVVAIAIAASCMGCVEEQTLLPDPIPVCDADWRTLDEGEELPFEFTLPEAEHFLETAEVLHPEWYPRVLHPDPEQELHLTAAADSDDARIGYLEDDQLLCQSGWVLRYPVTVTATVEGVLSDTDMTGFAYVQDLIREDTWLRTEGPAIFSETAEEEILAWLEDEGAVPGSESDWQGGLHGALSEGTFGVDMSYETADGSVQSTQSLIQGRWQPAE